MHEPLQPESITDGLETQRVGRRVRVLSEVGSTNEAALARADGPDADGSVLFAEHQTAGRGRLGRQWVSPRAASILCSTLLIRREQANEYAGCLTLISGIAVCDAVAASVPDVEPSIRWPNDIVVGERKLAGILIESRAMPEARAYAVGIGLNCLQHPGHFPPDLRATATSLDMESQAPVSRLAVARALLVALDRWLAEEPDTEKMRQAWLDRTEPLGQHIRVRHAQHEFSGRTIDIDPTGGLLMELDQGGRRVFDPIRTSLI